MEIVYASARELEQALRDTAVAHGRHERKIGREDPDWPVWYANYMARAKTDETP